MSIFREDLTGIERICGRISVVLIVIWVVCVVLAGVFVMAEAYYSDAIAPYRDEMLVRVDIERFFHG